VVRDRPGSGHDEIDQRQERELGMAANMQQQLIKYLTGAHAMEKQALLLLARGADIVGDEEVARIYRAHRLQTEEHERYVAERLQALGAAPSKFKDAAMQASGLAVGIAAQAAPDTPILLARTAFAFENLEIATYRLIRQLAQRAGDDETAEMAGRILEQEEAAAELVSGTFPRMVELTLDEPARSPLPSLTPLGKPSERPDDETRHEGPQSFKGVSPDEPVAQPPDIESPTDAEREHELRSPESGHPASDVNPPPAA
jgi:ferritin-like metal-binding protein YciE